MDGVEFSALCFLLGITLMVWGEFFQYVKKCLIFYKNICIFKKMYYLCTIRTKQTKKINNYEKKESIKRVSK